VGLSGRGFVHIAINGTSARAGYTAIEREGQLRYSRK
jgi:hypothetical protein